MIGRFVLAAFILCAAAARPAAAQGAPAIDYAKLRDEAAQRLSEYIRINTTNPPGNELASARWLADVLAKEGVQGMILDTAALGPGRANFYARLPGTGKGKAIALVHHMDVVAASVEDWAIDPFGGAIKDGSVWGRGAIDMKGHAIIQLMALIALKRAGVRLSRDLVYVANADEEIGGLGSRTFIERHPDLVKPIEYLLTEGADTRVENGRVRWFGIDVGEKRTWWKRLVAKGTTSHGSVPLGDNPVERLVRALGRISAYQTPVRLTPAVDRFFKAQARDETGPGKAMALERRGRAQDAEGTSLDPEPARAERAAPNHHHADRAAGVGVHQYHPAGGVGGARHPSASGRGHCRHAAHARAPDRRSEDRDRGGR